LSVFEAAAAAAAAAAEDDVAERGMVDGKEERRRKNLVFEQERKESLNLFAVSILSSWVEEEEERSHLEIASENDPVGNRDIGWKRRNVENLEKGKGCSCRRARGVCLPAWRQVV
jgi:hypothetical protein